MHTHRLTLNRALQQNYCKLMLYKKIISTRKKAGRKIHHDCFDDLELFDDEAVGDVL